MTPCPKCNHDVRTPSFLDLDGWRHLVCPNCKARLEMKPWRSSLMAPIMAPLFVLARQNRVLEVIAYAFSFATVVLMLLESVRPKVQLRKRPLPKPEIRLNIDAPLN